MSTSPAGATVPIRVLDLTLDRKDTQVIPEADGTIILGAPVYAGRLAPEAVRRLRRIQVPRGIIIPTVLTVTYGNRDYEDALVEIYDLAVELGLSPVAAGAFIGEHSYSTPALPIAEGRPDSLDLADARIFGGQCRRKLETSGAFAPFHIKGNRPYKEPSRPASDTSRKEPGPSTGNGHAKPAPAVPSVPVTADGCPLCGECAHAMPHRSHHIGHPGPGSADRSRLLHPLLRLRQGLRSRNAHILNSVRCHSARKMLCPPRPGDFPVKIQGIHSVAR